MERLLPQVVKPQVLPLKRLLKGFGLSASGFSLCSFVAVAASGYTVNPDTAFITTAYVFFSHDLPLSGYFLGLFYFIANLGN
jgi:hypothetical protein